jgi:hypothetical protein
MRDAKKRIEKYLCIIVRHARCLHVMTSHVHILLREEEEGEDTHVKTACSYALQ